MCIRDRSPTEHALFRPELQTPLSGPGAFAPRINDKPTLPGYTTVDDLGSEGDDTIHEAIRFYDVPNCIGANVDFDSSSGEPETVDLIYNEFIQDWVLLALRYLGVKYEKEDTKATLDDKTMTDVISDWVGEHWACEK